MQSELATRRRALSVTFGRYVEADRAWHAALDEMRVWFPPTDQPNRAAIGNPGSEIRRLYDDRQRALVLLEAAHLKLETARARLEEREARGRPRILVPS